MHAHAVQWWCAGRLVGGLSSGVVVTARLHDWHLMFRVPDGCCWRLADAWGSTPPPTAEVPWVPHEMYGRNCYTRCCRGYRDEKLVTCTTSVSWESVAGVDLRLMCRIDCVAGWYLRGCERGGGRGVRCVVMR